MNSVDRQRKYTKQTNQQYALLGKFVNKFELMIYQLRESIKNNAGLQDIRQQKISNIFLAEATANSLINIYRSIILLNPNLDKFTSTLISSLYKRTKDLISKRNEIIHGTYFIGWASQDDVEFSTSLGFKNKNKAIGVVTEPLELNKENMQESINECEFLTNFYLRFSMCLMMGFDMHKNLPLSEEEIKMLSKGKNIWG